MIRPGQRQRAEVKQRLVRQKRAKQAPPGFYTRADLTAKLNITEAELRALLRYGTFSSDGVNSEGLAVYSEALVRTLLQRQAEGTLFPKDIDTSAAKGGKPATKILPPVSYTAQDGVRVFALLAKGDLSFTEIVIETEIHPHAVKQIRRDYEEETGSISIPKAIVDQIAKLSRLPGPSPMRTPEEVLETLTLCNEDRSCSECGRNASSSDCLPCIRRSLMRQAQAQAQAQARQQQADAAREAEDAELARAASGADLRAATGT